MHTHAHILTIQMMAVRNIVLNTSIYIIIVTLTLRLIY